ncbi:unnamed protein product [Allacma fusca]|uniref:Secreted protein n=1 Tax=Allacma fusca TaxID=39272 RepID=A0A8J2P172_9HEXA|nr:unnamed protein product [Allacma fusca]
MVCIFLGGFSFFIFLCVCVDSRTTAADYVNLNVFLDWSDLWWDERGSWKTFTFIVILDHGRVANGRDFREWERSE